MNLKTHLSSSKYEQDESNDDIRLNSPKKLTYVVDPVNDSVMQKTYMTKFRMSNVQKFKLLAERQKKLTDLSSKASKIRGAAKKVVFNEEKVDVMDVSLNKDTENDSIDSLSQDSDSSDSGELCDIEQENRDIKILLNHKRKLSEEEQNKPSLSNETNTKSANDSKFKKGEAILVAPSKNKNSINNSSLKQTVEETKQSPKNTLKEPIKIEKLEEKAHQTLKQDSDKNEEELDNEIIDDNEENEASDDDNDFDLNDEDLQAYEGEELEDDEEFEDIEDLDEMLGDDMTFNNDDIKKLNPKQQLFLSQLFMPPDFKKDLFKKDPNEKNEVDYKSLRQAMDNSLQNMRTLKSMKNEFNRKKKKGLLGGISDIRPRSTDKKVKFVVSNNLTKRFDKSKVILIDSNRSKVLPILPPPLTGCLKK